ncbi:KilA-N domain-containing protein [Colletotrichum kahawae]|uniref:KilA-N domain-containing protein n=1 Tax=Colletotrichum kahawae TaxID=34407 RepID=A0AAE0D5A4_COLKA|nr:KilA-N domain-containing protein [Colletotrichum kahawae]
MTGATARTTPVKVPKLRGGSNWTTWKVSIGATLRAVRVNDYVIKDVAEPEEDDKKEAWTADRDIAYNILIMAAESLIDKLLNAGWEDDGDPYRLMEALKKYIPKVSEDAVGYLKGRITSLVGSWSDHYWAIVLLDYFKTRLPDTYKFYTTNNKTPTWNDVVQTLFTLAQDEEQKIGIAAFKKTTDVSQQSTGKGTASTTSSANRSATKCDHCGRAHPTQQCMTAHPELVPDDWASRKAILARAEKHVCNAKCEWDAPKNKPTDFAKHPVRDVVSKTVLTAVANQKIPRSDVILDSGCSDSIFNERSHFVTYEAKADLPPYEGANGEYTRPDGIGTVYFQTVDPQNLSKTVDWTVDNVEYSPLSPANLLSPGKLRDVGIEYDYRTTAMVQVSSGTPFAKVDWRSNVCVVPTVQHQKNVPLDTAISLAAVRRKRPPSFELMRRRLLHAHLDRVVEACRRVGITFATQEIKEFHCEACHLAKSTEIISRDLPLPLTSVGDEIHLDIMEVKLLSITGKRYVLHFMDRYSGYHWVTLLLNHNYEVVLNAIKTFSDIFTNMTHVDIKTWVCDNAPEFNKCQGGVKGIASHGDPFCCGDALLARLVPKPDLRVA